VSVPIDSEEGNAIGRVRPSARPFVSSFHSLSFEAADLDFLHVYES